MKLSMYLNPPSSGPEHDAEIIDVCIRQAERATNAGFAGVVLTEHHLSGYNTYCDNIVMAAHLAARTRPGTKFFLAVVVPPLHNPMRLAAQINLLVILTGGNVIVGLGAGGSAAIEPLGLGRDPQNRYEDYEAVLAAMRAATTKELHDPPISWSTRYESGTLYARLMPAGELAPVARALTSDDAAEEAGRQGVYLFTGRQSVAELRTRLDRYERGLEASGLDASEVAERLEWSFCHKNVIVRDTDREARTEAVHRIQRHQEFARALNSYVPKEASKGSNAPGKRYVHTATPEDFLEQGYIVGSPSTVRGELERYAEAGVRHLALEFNFAFMSPDEADRSIDLFIEDVLPHFSAHAASAASSRDTLIRH